LKFEQIKVTTCRQHQLLTRENIYFLLVFAIQLSALKERISLYFSLPGSQASGISHPRTRNAGGVFLVLRFGHQFKSAVFCSASKKRRRHSQAVFTEASGLLAIYFQDKQARGA
jgi:hypothetical protein